MERTVKSVVYHKHRLAILLTRHVASLPPEDRQTADFRKRKLEVAQDAIFRFATQTYLIRLPKTASRNHPNSARGSL